MGKKCPSCGKKADWQYFRFDKYILYKKCSHCSCLLLKDISWRFLNGEDLRILMARFTKKIRKELLEKKNKFVS